MTHTFTARKNTGIIKGWFVEDNYGTVVAFTYAKTEDDAIREVERRIRDGEACALTEAGALHYLGVEPPSERATR